MKTKPPTKDYKYNCSYEVKFVLDTHEKYKDHHSEFWSKNEIPLKNLEYSVVSDIIQKYNENYNCKDEDDFLHFGVDDFKIVKTEIGENEYIYRICEETSDEYVYFILKYEMTKI